MGAANQILPRSYLFVPGDRPERFSKAFAAGADAVIIDLEDAVAADNKSEARKHVQAWLASGVPTYVRLNGAGTPWFEEDLQLCGSAGLAGVLLPKAERADVLEQLDGRFGENCQLLPLIETALGLSNIAEIASAPGVHRLVFGSIDFMLDMGIEDDVADTLLYFRSHIVLHSRLAGLASPVDGVTAQIDNEERLRSDTRRAAQLGFGARLSIHPRQIELIHEGFAPSAEQLAWAMRVLSAAVESGGACMVDGEMIDRPVLLRAEAMIARQPQQQLIGDQGDD